MNKQLNATLNTAQLLDTVLMVLGPVAVVGGLMARAKARTRGLTPIPELLLLLGVLMLCPAPVQGGPVFVGLNQENIDIRTTIIGNNNIVINNINKIFIGNVFNIGVIDPPVPDAVLYNPFNGPTKEGNAAYDPGTNLTTVTWSRPGGEGIETLVLSGAGSDRTHIGIEFAGGGPAGPGGLVGDALNVQAITMSWDDLNTGMSFTDKNFPAIGTGVSTTDAGPKRRLNFNLEVTPAVDPTTFAGYEFASPGAFNEHGSFEVSLSGFQFLVTNANPFPIFVSGQLNLSGDPPLNIKQLTQFPPQPTRDVGIFLQQNGLQTVDPSFYNIPFVPQTIPAGGSLPLQAVPEPASFVLLATGLAGLLGYGWRRRAA